MRKGLVRCIILQLIIVLSYSMGDMIGFKECQKRFGFSKKLREIENKTPPNTDEIIDINDIDRYVKTKEEDSNFASSSEVNRELSEFYHCLGGISGCHELIETDTQQYEHRNSFDECFQECYNSHRFTTKFVKNLVDFSLQCGKDNLRIQFSPQMTINSNIQRKLPWSIMLFGLIISMLFIGWVNIDRIYKRFCKKQANSLDLAQIYSFNPDYLASQRFQQNQLVQNVSKQEQCKIKQLQLQMNPQIDSHLINQANLLINKDLQVENLFDNCSENDQNQIKLPEKNNFLFNSDCPSQIQTNKATQINQNQHAKLQQSGIFIESKALNKIVSPSNSISPKKIQVCDDILPVYNQETKAFLRKNSENESYLEDYMENDDPFDL